jgi:RNAse (barnase) inhibitor barstar
VGYAGLGPDVNNDIQMPLEVVYVNFSESSINQ